MKIRLHCGPAAGPGGLRYLFLVRDKEVRTSPRTGKSWLQLELVDRTGTIEAKMWDNFDGHVPQFERDDIVKIRARVQAL